MGATDYTTTFSFDKSKEDICKIWDAAVEQAIIESGHDSYNGTISTMYGGTVRDPRSRTGGWVAE